MSRRLVTRRTVQLLGVLGLLGCETQDIVAIRRCTDTTCSSPDTAFCAGTGPRISAAQDPRICGGALLANLLPAALCTCSGMSGGDLFTDAGNALGSLGPIDSQGSWEVGGALRSSSSVQVMTGSLLVRGPVQIQSSLRGNNATFQGDAEVGGDISLVNLAVGGTLTTSATSTIMVSDPGASPNRRTAAVTVAPPCPCDLDPYVSGPILALSQSNDDTRLGLDPNQLEGYAGSPVLTLPCGRYFFQRVSGLGGLEFRITGRVELAIAGGLDVGGQFQVTLAPSAELDLYVHGDVTVGGAVAMGDKAAPTRLRFFPGGVDTVRLAGGGYVSAAVLGRRRVLITSAPLEIYGAVIAENVSINASLKLHYDPQILNITGSCGP